MHPALRGASERSDRSGGPVVLVIRRGGHGAPGDWKGDEDRRTILDRRYAAGTLSREEYRRAREDLER